MCSYGAAPKETGDAEGAYGWWLWCHLRLRLWNPPRSKPLPLNKLTSGLSLASDALAQATEADGAFLFRLWACWYLLSPAF